MGQGRINKDILDLLDKECQREIKMREIETPIGIKSIIKKIEAINKEEDRINVIQKLSHRIVVTQDQKKINSQPVHTRQQEFPTRSNYGRVNTNINERRNVLTCWTCHKDGHMSWNCW